MMEAIGSATSDTMKLTTQDFYFDYLPNPQIETPKTQEALAV